MQQLKRILVLDFVDDELMEFLNFFNLDFANHDPKKPLILWNLNRQDLEFIVSLQHLRLHFHYGAAKSDVILMDDVDTELMNLLECLGVGDQDLIVDGHQEAV